MRWPWNQGQRTGRDRAPMARRVVEAADLPACVGCGKPLGSDPEDEPDGEGRGLPICGECNRARNFDAMLEGGELR